MPNEIANVERMMFHRENAERILASKMLNVPQIPSGDIRALIHELQVHQIELELQNEELHKTQSILEISRKRFSDLYDCAPAGYLTLDNIGNIIEVNRTAMELLGYDKVEMLGKPLSFLASHLDMDVLYQHIKHLRQGLSHSCELHLSRKDDSLFYSKLSSTPFADENRGYGELLVTILDITARKLADEMSSRLASIVDGTQDAIISVTLDGTIVSWNKGAEKIYGYAEYEVKGQPLSILVPPNLRDNMPQILNKITEGILVEHAETMHVRKDGSLVPVSFTASPIRTMSGTVIGASTIASNIADRRKWEESILSLNSRLQSSNKELEALGHVLSHDLRAPVRAIEGSARLLADDSTSTLGAEGVRCLQTIADSAKRVDEMIVGLLKISKVTRNDITRSSVNISNMVRLISRSLKKRDPARKVEFRIQENVIADGDEPLVHMAVENLLRNAWQFTGKRDNAVIEFGTVDSHGKNAYFIRDNGAGFDMAFVGKMFLTFERLHEESDFTGTGIGLSTVKRIVLHHGGDVWADGEVGKGATFYFTLQ